MILPPFPLLCSCLNMTLKKSIKAWNSHKKNGHYSKRLFTRGELVVSQFHIHQMYIKRSALHIPWQAYSIYLEYMCIEHCGSCLWNTREHAYPCWLWMDHLCKYISQLSIMGSDHFISHYRWSAKRPKLMFTADHMQYNYMSLWWPL